MSNANQLTDLPQKLSPQKLFSSDLRKINEEIPNRNLKDFEISVWERNKKYDELMKVNKLYYLFFLFKQIFFFF